MNSSFATRYEPAVLLGRGTTATVEEAMDRETGRWVALRTIHTWHASHRVVRERFHALRARLADVAGEHAIRVLAAGEEGSRLHVVTERVHATRLDSVVAEGALPWSRVIDIVAQVCTVLAELHARGAVHGKVSAGKIYLGQRQIAGGDPYRSAHVGDVVRLDLGCCPAGTIIADASLRLDRSPEFRYSSPEQLLGRALDPRSDVFAIGVLAYELATGRRPFPSRPIYAQLHMRAEPPSRHVPLSPTADALILRCLEVDRERRFANTDELRAALASTA